MNLFLHVDITHTKYTAIPEQSSLTYKTAVLGYLSYTEDWCHKITVLIVQCQQ